MLEALHSQAATASVAHRALQCCWHSLRVLSTHETAWLRQLALHTGLSKGCIYSLQSLCACRHSAARRQQGRCTLAVLHSPAALT